MFGALAEHSLLGGDVSLPNSWHGLFWSAHSA